MRELTDANWGLQVAQSAWVGSGWPGLAAERQSDGLRFWVCAYDWRIDFGVSCDQLKPTDASFIVGLINVPDNAIPVRLTDGRSLSDADFLITTLEDVNRLAELFFSGEMVELARQLLRHSPVNGFSNF